MIKILIIYDISNKIFKLLKLIWFRDIEKLFNVFELLIIEFGLFFIIEVLLVLFLS